MSPEQASPFSGFAGPQSVTSAIKRAGAATGASFDLLYQMARRESSLNPRAEAKTSSAAGLFQFIEETWLAAVKKYGAKHGLAAEAASIAEGANGRPTVVDAARKQAILNLRFDPEKAAALAGELTQENRAGLERRLGRSVGKVELYAAHFLGVGGAAKLLSAVPSAKAADIVPAAAAANKPVFYSKGAAKSVEEVLASIAQSMGGAAPKATPAPAARGPAPPSVREFDLALATRSQGGERGVAPSRTNAYDDARGRLYDLVRSNALGEALSPLAIAVLQSLDPTELASERRERDSSSLS